MRAARDRGALLAGARAAGSGPGGAVPHRRRRQSGATGDLRAGRGPCPGPGVWRRLPRPRAGKRKGRDRRVFRRWGEARSDVRRPGAGTGARVPRRDARSQGRRRAVPAAPAPVPARGCGASGVGPGMSVRRAFPPGGTEGESERSRPARALPGGRSARTTRTEAARSPGAGVARRVTGALHALTMPTWATSK